MRVILLIRRVPPTITQGLPNKPEIKAAKEPRAKQVKMFVRRKSTRPFVDLAKDGMQTIELPNNRQRCAPEEQVAGELIVLSKK